MVTETSSFGTRWHCSHEHWRKQSCITAVIGVVITRREASGQVIRSWLECHEFEPSTTKDPHCRGCRCTLSMSRLKRSAVSVVSEVRRLGARTGVVLVTCPWFNMTRSVAKSPQVAEQRERERVHAVNTHKEF
ncbi:hypothetical protein TNCV_2914031 [Trichonephila clavipes]|nr:hypothetical protein TNCV_2914031 [Trichonephila clavipes]